MNLYRCEGSTSCSADEDGYVIPSTRCFNVFVHEIPVVKVTPKGHWINWYGERRFVRSAARKQFASVTPELAIASFIARKQRQMSILRAQTHTASALCKVAQRMLDKHLTQASAPAYDIELHALEHG